MCLFLCPHFPQVWEKIFFSPEFLPVGGQRSESWPDVYFALTSYNRFFLGEQKNCFIKSLFLAWYRTIKWYYKIGCRKGNTLFK